MPLTEQEAREIKAQLLKQIEKFPEEARELAQYLIKEAKQKNATIVTASPHCYSHLKEYGDVVDLLQLIEENI